MVKCEECGCACNRCLINDHDVHLHVEIESLKQKLVERESHIVTMETNFLNEANKFPSGEIVALREELLSWQDKYKRLYEAHRRVQRVNQGLEDKLLKLVDVCETEKTTLTKDVATLSQNLAEANYAVKKLAEDNERYKNDVSLAIQFLQCKQSNFVAHRFDTLPEEVQMEVSSHMTNKRKPQEKKISCEMKSIKVPIPTFPPTAMVYSVPKLPNSDTNIEVESQPVDIVSAAIMAKVLEERQKEKAFAKHCDTCTCSKKLNIVFDITHHTTGTQTGNYTMGTCLKCNENFDNLSKIQVVHQDASTKKVQSVPNDSTDTAQLNGNNIVKVQPNNFLANENFQSDLNRNNFNISPTSLKSQSDVNFFSINEVTRLKTSKSPKLGVKMGHHRLCKDKPESEINSAKEGASCNMKGPRVCSMRLQSGTKNILLDNAQNNIEPVLYTRYQKTKSSTNDISQISSCSSEDVKSNYSLQNQKRVEEWVRNNLEDRKTENLQCEVIESQDRSETDQAKYAEMEDHVKRFLFGESEFLKTVEMGKLKYQNLRNNEGNISNSINFTNIDQ